MEVWAEVAVVTVPIVLLLLAIVVTIRRRSRRRRRPPGLPLTSTGESMQSRLARLHGSYEKDSLRFHPLHSRSRQRDRGGGGGGTGGLSHQDQEVFRWEEHPALAADAAENGWARFAFSDGNGSGGPAPPASLLGLCVGRDGEGNSSVEGTWELPLESSEFMQVVRLNPGTKNKPASATAAAGDAVEAKEDAAVCCCLARMDLPLPGPPAGTGFFPPDGYFEITILYLQSPERQPHLGTRTPDSDTATPKSKPEVSSAASAISVGLTAGAAPEGRLPGSYPGSIRMDSDRSLHLDGTELVPPSTKSQSNWAALDRVVGCGYSPGRKRVWFTADGELLHVVHCRGDAFQHPMYPALAASDDVMVLVNMGQQKFRYAPANAQRSASPCFEVQLSVGGGGSVKSTGGVGDSGELFSIGRVDPRWLERGRAEDTADDACGGAVRRSDSCYSCNTVGDDSELFEIDLKRVRQ